MAGVVLITTLRKFSAHAEKRGDHAMRDEVLGKADEYAEAVERSAWDGEWYRVLTSTTDLRWARGRATSARSIRSRKAGA